MSKESPQPTEPFAFTEHEKLSDERIKTLLDDAQTTIHRVEVNSNSYGEFLFVTISRPEEGGRKLLTFFGCGYHEYRERWFTDEWAWYRANPFAKTLEQHVTRDEANELLEARRKEIAALALGTAQSRRGQLFEMLAEMTDEGAPRGAGM